MVSKSSLFPVLELSRLAIHRGKTPILRDVDWRVEPGQHWVVLGANGSGKTSLLSALTGYLTPSTGSIRMLGEAYGETDWRVLRERVGIVSSSIRQKVPDWDPAELVVIGGKYAMLDYWGRVKRQDRVEAMQQLRRAGCAHLAGRDWAVLSQGERQRVLIARALIARPSVLILDEPCAGLDPVAREKFLRFLEKLCCRRGAPSLLFVTHHVEEIFPALTHALLLKNGRVLAAGRVEETLTEATLSCAFGARVEVKRVGDRWAMQVAD